MPYDQRNTRRYSPRHQRDRERRYIDTWSAIGPFGHFLLFLIYTLCIVLSVLILVQPTKKNDPAPYSSYTFNTPIATAIPTSTATTVPDTPSPEPVQAPGTLVESGKNINDNYYKMLDFSGTPSDLSVSSFVLGKERPATIGKTGQDYPGKLTIYFDENTMIKTAKLYYADDKFEIYMGSINDLQIIPGKTFDVILEDPNAAELRAKEIIVSEFVF